MASETLSELQILRLGFDELTETFKTSAAAGSSPGFDAGADVWKSQIRDPEGNLFTPAISIATANAIGDIDDTWKDQGTEIDVQGWASALIWGNFSVNLSTGNQLQILSKRESAGLDEYVLEDANAFKKTIGDSDIKIVYDFVTSRGMSALQIQTKATTVGATPGQVTIYVTRGY